MVLDLDETLICAYETSSLPAIIRNQATEAGLKWFELECLSSDKVSLSLVILCSMYLAYSMINMISLDWRTGKENLRSIMLLSLNVLVCKSSWNRLVNLQILFYLQLVLKVWCFLAFHTISCFLFLLSFFIYSYFSCKTINRLC